MSSQVSQPTFYGWRYCHYFEITEDNGNNIKVKCCLFDTFNKLITSIVKT